MTGTPTDDPDQTVEVVVGSSYSGAQPVTLTGEAPEPATPASEAPVVTAASDPCAA